MMESTLLTKHEPDTTPHDCDEIRRMSFAELLYYALMGDRSDDYLPV